MWTVLYLILNFISLIHSHILFHISNTSSHSSLCKTRITFFHFFQLSTAFWFTFWHGGFYLAINSAELYLCNTHLHNLFSLFPPSPSNLCFPVSLSASMYTFIKLQQSWNVWHCIRVLKTEKLVSLTCQKMLYSIVKYLWCVV